MTKAAFKKFTAGFLAEDDEAMDLVRKYEDGTRVMIEVRRPRNLGQHRLYFKLLQTVHDNLPEPMTERFPNVDKLLIGIKFAIGLTDTVIVGGVEHEYPRSIAFESMPQDEFEESVWKPTLDLVEQKIIPGIDRAELEREVRELIQ